MLGVPAFICGPPTGPPMAAMLICCCWLMVARCRMPIDQPWCVLGKHGVLRDEPGGGEWRAQVERNAKLLPLYESRLIVAGARG